jgi:hypothetical protein
MNIRNVVLLAVILLVAVNTALLILAQQLPPCPDVGGTPGVPGWIACPSPSSYDCDNGRTWWRETGKQWIIQTSLGGDYIASSEGAMWPQPPSPPVFFWRSFEVDVIAQTGAVCGGRRYSPQNNFFRPTRSDNEDDLVMQDADRICYISSDCDWIFIGNLNGWELQGTEYKHFVVPNYSCNTFPFLPLSTNKIWVPCQEDNGGDGGA